VGTVKEGYKHGNVKLCVWMLQCGSLLGYNSGNSLLLCSSIIIAGSLKTEKGSYSGIAWCACSEKMWYANKALHTEKETEDGWINH